MTVAPDPDQERRERDAAVNARHQWLGSVGPFLMEINGRYRLFEFNGVMGPILVDDAGEMLKVQPAINSPFWAKFDAWSKSGCFVDKHKRAYVPSAPSMPPLP